MLTKEAEKQATNLVDSQAQANNVPAFDARLWVGRSLALLCHLAIFAGLIVVGLRHFNDLHAGMAAATFYLLLPYTALHVEQWHHVWPMALVVWAVVFYRKPSLAGLLLGLAAGTVYFPLLILPVWCSFYWGRGDGRFLGAFALTFGLCLAATGADPLVRQRAGRQHPVATDAARLAAVAEARPRPRAASGPACDVGLGLSDAGVRRLHGADGRRRRSGRRRRTWPTSWPCRPRR